MRIAECYVLREIADTWVVIPVGQKLVEFNGIINLNETGAFLWKKLQGDVTEDDLVALLLDEYQVSEEIARRDVVEFLDVVRSKGLIV